ncbi:uncharacterized protein LOC133325575 [Musca vetustissima]|uniref:uncharacterized protein LOC133325575 n=1 Tax=Musca vetustissima TaxID=27455 RepID=UPI002AB64411|nr:uncharacterized protein LOC133325575 [Musca vetustissima]
MEAPEEKLQKYRMKKKRREKFQRFVETITGFAMTDKRSGETNDKPELVRQQTSVHSIDEDSSEESISNVDTTHESRNDIVLRYLLRVAYIALWLILYIIAIELEFGIVYLILSGFVVMYINTRTGPKNPDEVSAYSVFNKDFVSIDGSLKAEQFEREMGIR